MCVTKYPIYIISKGRWENPLTARSLDKMGVPYKIVVEPSEYDNYTKHINSENVIKCPENFSQRGQGSIPVRNYVWDLSFGNGDERHWIIDDNINGFERLNNNQRIKVFCGGIFRASEDFCDRYKNVALAGFEYRQFSGGARRLKPPYRINHRVYSTTLINNKLPHRWRGKYNEDTDLCLRVLKDGWVTVTFNCFLQNKVATMTMKGGNTDTIYNLGDNRREFAESLKKNHPDLVDVVWRYDRWHHDVDYSSFHQQLEFKEGIKIKEGINEYGMKLIEL